MKIFVFLLPQGLPKRIRTYTRSWLTVSGFDAPISLATRSAPPIAWVIATEWTTDVYLRNVEDLNFLKYFTQVTLHLHHKSPDFTWLLKSQMHPDFEIKQNANL